MNNNNNNKRNCFKFSDYPRRHWILDSDWPGGVDFKSGLNVFYIHGRGLKHDPSCSDDSFTETRVTDDLRRVMEEYTVCLTTKSVFERVKAFAFVGFKWTVLLTNTVCRRSVFKRRDSVFLLYRSPLAVRFHLQCRRSFGQRRNTTVEKWFYAHTRPWAYPRWPSSFSESCTFG